MNRFVKVDSDGMPVFEAWTPEDTPPEQGMVSVDPTLNLSNKKYCDNEWVDIIPIPEYEKDLIDAAEESMLEMQTNIQYLVELAEINMEGV